MPTRNKTAETFSKDIASLYDQYSPAVYAVIVAIITDQRKSEEVLVKIFSNLSLEINKYEHNRSLVLWLTNLSRNECITQLIEDNNASTTAPVNNYLKSLPLLHKTIFALVYFKGLNISEVAALLHLQQDRIEDVFNGLPNFTPYMFPNMKRTLNPVPDILQSLMQNLVPENDELRVAALKKYEILYTPPEQTFDKITRMIADVFNTPMAFLSLVDKETVFYKSQVGPFERSQVDRENSLCSLTVLSREPLIIEDTSLAGCFKDNPLVNAAGGIKFYAGAPLITQDGFLIGALCVVDTNAREFSFKDTVLLTEFAEMAMQEIESRHQSFQQLLFKEQVKNAGNKP